MIVEKDTEISATDILFILENIWEKSKPEWLLTTEDERKETLVFIQNRLKSAHPYGYAKIWKTATGEPIGILGAYKIEDKRYETFFICSRHMEEHAMKLSFEMRKILLDLSIEYKGCALGQYAEAHRTDQRSWFRFLGFSYKPEGNVGNRRYFEYVSPNT
ncbi:hypothetical protein [Maribacter antarcticus]|uniref:hypothetical protein n=1 Tax=Maribacter antarcticus TaxID=505250 RepID=UPI00047E05E5|nr:hypothetical protein [Maribacter antarcticus]